LPDVAEPAPMDKRLARTYRSIVGDAPPWVLASRLFFALGWLRAAVEKLIDPFWWNGSEILTFLDRHRESELGWCTLFVDRIVVPHVDVVVIAVVVLQIGAGLSLLTGRSLGAGLALGIFLNLNFVAAGAVNPSAFYLVGQGALVFWLVDERPSSASRRVLLAGVGVVIALGLASIPFVSTVRPDAVIDDPAVMLITLAVLSVITTCETIRRHHVARAAALPAPRRRAGPAMLIPEATSTTRS
jgi:hypothetical protein